MPATIWKGHLSFGLVSIPIKIYRAARAEKISFRQLYRVPEPAAAGVSWAEAEEPEEEPMPAPVPPSGKRAPAPEPEQAPAGPEPAVAPIRQGALTQTGEHPLPHGSLVKGYEYEKDRYVVIDKNELKALAPKNTGVMEIREFAHLAEIDPVYFETSYYAAPDPRGQRAYAILFEALRRTGYVALAEVVMHNRQHVVVVRPGRKGILIHTMFYEDEVRKELEYPADPQLATDKELDLAVTLIKALAAPFQPGKYKDVYRERVEALIAAKVQGRETAKAAPAPAPRAQVIDIMEALKKSVEAVRKPAAPAGERTPAKSAARKSGKKSRSA